MRSEMSLKASYLAVFDVDGTICDTQGSDGLCFGLAVGRVLGRPFAAQEWTTYEEPTGGAILRELLAGDPDAAEKETAVKLEFLSLLERQRGLSPNEFMPLPGATAFVHRLRHNKNWDVAIATGCFDVSAAFKLRCCGLELTSFPHATSSDTPRRQDIIRLAVSRAGHEIADSIYLGDGIWDVKATKAVGIPMVGIGRGIARLSALGIDHAFRDYSDPDSIIGALQTFRS